MIDVKRKNWEIKAHTIILKEFLPKGKANK